MKRIIARVDDGEHLETIAKFCDEEKLFLQSIGPKETVCGDNAVVFITDDKNFDSDVPSSVPVCFIGDCEKRCRHYSLKRFFKVYHLRMLLDALYHGALITNYSSSLVPVSVFKEYSLENDYSNIDRIVCFITAELPLFFTFSDLEKIRVGISEIITNAIEHGNLGITGQEKMESTENGTYYELLEERLKNEELSKRRTRVRVDMKNGSLTVTVRDDGDGFDTSKIPDPTDGERLFKLHGRGIFIARMYFDEINYNDKGNEVTLVKKSPDNSISPRS